MHEADRLAKKLSVATSRVAEIMSLGESEIVDGANSTHIIPTAIWESDHVKTYLRARTVMLRAVSYRKSKPDPGLDAQIASLDDLSTAKPAQRRYLTQTGTCPAVVPDDRYQDLIAAMRPIPAVKQV